MPTMQTIALITGCLLVVAVGLFILAGAAALHARARSTRFTAAVGQLWMIAGATMTARPETTRPELGATLRLVGAKQIKALLRQDGSEMLVDALLGWLYDRAVTPPRDPARAPTPTQTPKW